MKVSRLVQMSFLLLICLGLIATLGLSSTSPMVTSEIERYRKGGAILKVIGKTGKPVISAKVNFTQIQHDFLFGVGQTTPEPPYPLSLYKKLADIGINYALPWLSWEHIEPNPGHYNWRFADYNYMPKALSKLGYTLNGHCFIWFYERYGNLPSYLRSLSFEELLAHTYSHVYDVVEHYKSSISYWTINEPVHQNPLDLSLEQWIMLIKKVTQAVTDADSGGKVMINLWPHSIPEEHYEPNWLIATLLNHQVEFDVIGIELYPFSNPKDYPTMSWISQLLDSFSIFGKPVILSEVSVPNRPSEEAQAKWLQDLYVMTYGKAFMKGVTWYFITDDPWLPGGGLLNLDYTPRKAYHTLKKLLNSWTTKGNGKTDSKGELRFRGFGGEYKITISAPGYKMKTTKIHIAERKENTYRIELEKSRS